MVVSTRPLSTFNNPSTRASIPFPFFLNASYIVAPITSGDAAGTRSERFT